MIDCQENPYTNILDMGFYKYQDYILELKMNISPEALCYSKRSWERLDSSKKMVLNQAIQETTGWIYQKADEMNERAKEELEHRGMKVLIPNDAEKQLWKSCADQLFQEEKYQELLNKIEKAKNML